jgi:hypothetical protein
MAKVQNTFIKSKMNRDLDPRIIPNGEYIFAENIQISKSEGNGSTTSTVGSLENVLGNIQILNIDNFSNAGALKCIGHFANEVDSTVYLFLTNNQNTNANFGNDFDPIAEHVILSYNTLTLVSKVLVRGAFLNFSQQNLITGVNILESLLFWTDNRNQPRVIDVRLANPNAINKNPTYYITEDQISVAKYNPYQCMELFQKSVLAPGATVPYETTMKDVSSKFLPNGGLGRKTGIYASANSITLNAGSVVGDIMNPNGVYSTTATIGYITSAGGNIVTIAGAQLSTVTPPTYDPIGNTWTITITGGVFPEIAGNTETYQIIINPNPYYNSEFSGDKDYLESKFVRFSYRFKYQDNTYSIFAPFTQIAFIPKKDGYFMYVKKEGVQDLDDQEEAYRSTIVYFVENKVNDINLRIPLPYTNYDMLEALKLKSIDILYKESDGLSVKAIETIPVQNVLDSAGTCLIKGDQPTPAGVIPAGTPIGVSVVQGFLNTGDIVKGINIPNENSTPAVVTTLVSFIPDDVNNPISGSITLDQDIPSPGLENGSLLIVGDINYFDYNYRSSKPTKTIPESELIRVYDKVPVKALAQEVAGNRVMYGNFINKIDPPLFINYNVAVTEKCLFETREVEASTPSGFAGGTFAPGTVIQIDLTKLYTPPDGLFIGMTITSSTYGVNIPIGTLITSTDNNGQVGSGTQVANITLDQTVTFPNGAILFIIEPGANTESCTSVVEYPNHSVKTNRNYQVGFVLSDRYGRQSSVILSNNKAKLTVNGISYIGSTLYSPYIDEGVDKDEWRGNSIKLLINEPITTNIYNGDITSTAYNPLGWYSYKVVVKQTEQEYYNVYLPGIMSGYPEDELLEIGNTSHTVLINDNINKVPRDLNEVGPAQKQFRSSVQLFGRVQNTSDIIIDTNPGASSTQYYPDTNSDTVSTISTIFDLFNYNPLQPFQPNYFPQFYSLDSNPLLARISTESKIGQTSQTNYAPASAKVQAAVAEDLLVPLQEIVGTINVGDLVFGADLPDGVFVFQVDTVAIPNNIQLKRQNDFFDVTLAIGTILTFVPSINPTTGPPFILAKPGIQYLAVYETEPVESLLDIFWETSTSGLISDLNSTIINNQSEPGAGNIGGWNDDTFNEGLPRLSDILQAPFNLVNDFGADITLTTAQIANGDGLFLLDVKNGNGDSVYTNSPTPTEDYFRLRDTSAGQTGVGPWQIQTTDDTTAISPSINYYDKIFYMYNAAGEQTNPLRNFTFYFNAIVGGQVSQITQTASLRNVIPKFTLVTQLESEIPGSPLTPPNIPLSPNIIICEAKRNEQNILSLESENGANNPALVLLDKAYVGFTQFSPPSPFIFRQKIGSFAESAEDALLNGSPIFGLTPSGTLINNMFREPGLRALTYYVIIRVQDAGDNQDIIIEVDMSLDIPTDIIKNQVAYTAEGNESFNCNPNLMQQNNNPYHLWRGASTASALQGVYTPFIPKVAGNPYTIIDTTIGGIPGLLPEQEGYFIYAGGFFNDTFNGSPSWSRESFSLTEYSGIPNNLPLGAPPIVIPWLTPDNYNNKVIKDTDSDVLNFAGTTPIQAYTIGTITKLEKASSGVFTSNDVSVIQFSVDSGESPVSFERVWFGPADGTLPTAPPATWWNWLPPNDGNLDDSMIILKDSPANYGWVLLPNGEYRVQVNGNVTTGSAALPDAAVGNKIYLFGGMISAMGLYSPWWGRPTGNPTLGSPWYFSKDKQKVLDMFHYSPWCGIGPNLPAQDDGWLDSCPTECEHDGGDGSSGLPDNYLQAVYTGVECDVTNYSNLNWDII